MLALSSESVMISVEDVCARWDLRFELCSFDFSRLCRSLSFVSESFVCVGVFRLCRSLSFVSESLSFLTEQSLSS